MTMPVFLERDILEAAANLLRSMGAAQFLFLGPPLRDDCGLNLTLISPFLGFRLSFISLQPAGPRTFSSDRLILSIWTIPRH